MGLGRLRAARAFCSAPARQFTFAWDYHPETSDGGRLARRVREEADEEAQGALHRILERKPTLTGVLTAPCTDGPSETLTRPLLNAFLPDVWIICTPQTLRKPLFAFVIS